MPRRSEKALESRKPVRSSFSRTGRPAHLHINTNSPALVNVTSRLESIGSLIIEELKGSKRDRLRKQLLTSCSSQPLITKHLPASSSRRSLQRILADLSTFECLSSRQYRTIGIGDDDDDMNRNAAMATKKASDTSIERSKNIEMSYGESQPSRAGKRKTRHTNALNSSQSVADKSAEPLSTTTRTICTRSSKLIATNNSQEQLDHIIPSRRRKQRSSLSKNIDTQSDMNSALHSTEKVHPDPHPTLGEDVTGVRVLRKKLQSSIPSVEHEKTTNDF